MRQQHIFDLLSSFSSSPPYFYAGLGTQYYVTTVSRDIFGRAMPGTYFRAESAYFKREKDDSRDILTAFKDRRRFLDISNYEKQKKKISCHMHFKKLWYNETLTECCEKKIKHLIEDETWFGMFEAILESAPQFIMQLYATIVQQEQVSTIRMVSLCVSFLSLAWTSTNADVWCFVTVGKSFNKKYLPTKFITKTFFLISQIFHLSSRLFAITFFSVAFKWWIVVVVMFHNIAIASVAFWDFRANDQSCHFCTPIFMFVHGVFYWITDDGACGLHFDSDVDHDDINVKIVKKASHFLFVIENVIMISVFYSKEEIHSWYSVPVTVCVCVFSLVGCLMRVAICRYFLRE